MNETSGNGGGQRLAVLAVGEYTDKEGTKRTRWTRIGAAFRNRDGSLTLRLSALPLGTDKLQVREERQDGEPARGGGIETVEVRP
jgi:hypothetical protein